MRWRRLLPAVVLIPAAAALSPWALRRARPLVRAALERTTGGSPPLTPATLAGELWGDEEADSHSPGAQRVRAAARDLFPKQAPGHGGEWRFSPAQVAKLKAQLEEG